MEENTETKNGSNDVRSRSDGWSNVISGLGTAYDKRTHTKWSSSSASMDVHTLSDMYQRDGLVQRIVNAFPDDMTREWISIPDDKRDDKNKEGFLEGELRRLGAQKIVNLALKWARLMGGSLIFVGAMDGRAPEKELKLDSVKSVEFLRVFDLNEIDTSGSDFETNPSKSEYGRIIRYKIRPKQLIGTELPKPHYIHYTRCMPFHGIEIPSTSFSATYEQRYWGISAMFPVWDYIRDFSGVMGSVSQILYEFIIGKYKLADLDEMLAQGNEGALQVRVQAIEMTKSIIRAVLLGTDEDYTRDAVSLSGIPDTIDRFMMMLSSVTEIPVSRLFGRSPAGMNATGENDIKNYYDVAHSKQSNDLTPVVGTLVSLLAAANNIDPAPAFVWNPLEQLSDKDQRENGRLKAEELRTKANAYQMLVQEGILTPEEVYSMEFEEILGKKDFEQIEEDKLTRQMEVMEKMQEGSEEEEEEEEGSEEEGDDSIPGVDEEKDEKPSKEK